MAYNEVLAERMRAQLKSKRGVVEKQLFGGIGFLVNGNLACGIHKQELIVRLGPDEFERALQQPHARIFDAMGKPMKGWLLVSPAGCASEKALLAWIEKGLAFAKSLPKK